jgi:hypothetical protein
MNATNGVVTLSSPAFRAAAGPRFVSILTIFAALGIMNASGDASSTTMTEHRTLSSSTKHVSRAIPASSETCAGMTTVSNDSSELSSGDARG